MGRKIWWPLLSAAVLVLFGAGAYAQDQLAELLTSTPWCSFKYNKVTGYSSTTRYQFFRDGRYLTGARAEGYSSGGGGSLTSQRDRTSGGTWQLQGNALYVTADGVVQAPANLSVKNNNNGSPVIMADGVEFVPCK